MNRYITIYSTAPNEEEAKKLGDLLAEKRLVACTAIIPKIRTIYRWKGKMCDETEVLMIMKTASKHFEAIKDFFKKNHSYECPELISLPILDGLPDYLKWIDDNTN